MPCMHEKTHYEPWPDGGDIEVCEECGMSRHHWEQGRSDWIMIEDIKAARKSVQESIDRMREPRKIDETECLGISTCGSCDPSCPAYK